jgi:HEAT repeat protein
MLRTRRLVGRAQAVQDPTWNRALLEISDRLDLVRTPKLVVSRAVSLPMTCGILQPAVVLPSGSSEWSADRRDAVLCHELAHIRRRDLLSHLLGHAACALYWFNPMAWRAARRLRAESERSCDDLVLSLGTRASAYADHLLQIATAGHASVAPAAALPMAQPKEFEARLLSILAPGMRRTTLPFWQGSALVALVLFCAAPLIALSPRSTLDAAAEGAGVAGIGDGAGPADPAFLDGLGSDSHAAPPTGVTPPSASASSTAASPSPSAAALADEDQDLDRALDREVTELDASARRLAAGVLDLVSASLGDAWPAILDGAQNPSPEARAALTAALRDPDREVRRISAWALGSQSDSTAVRALTAALAGDPDAEVREMSAWALAQQGRRFVDASAVDALSLAVVQDEAADVRSMAAWALGSLEPDGAESALERALATDADQSVRSMSAWALGQIGADSSKEALAAALGSGEARVKEQAAWALGQIGSGPAPASLIAALGDESAQVREVTAWALGRIEDPAAVPGLVQAVADPEGGVRSAALWALSQMDREPLAIAALTAALQDPNQEVRRAAARALGGAGGGAWPWPRPMPRPRPTP